MKPKILVIPESFPTEINPVAGIFIQDQIKALAPHCDLSVFNSNPWYRGEYTEMEEAKFFDFHLYASKPPSILRPLAYLWWEAQSLRIAKEMPKPDLIHLHGVSMRGRWVQKLAEYWGVPFVVAEHTGPWSAISNRKMLLKRVKNVMANAAEVWPVSNHLKSEMADSGFASKKVKLLGNPVDTKFFDLRKTNLSDSNTILFVGRLDDFKGGLKTLKAFHSIMDQVSDFNLCIAGVGQESGAISDYIKSNDMDGRVDFIDQQLSREEMKTLFHRAAFFVFPSRFESFGLVGIEAMSTGLPVLLTDRTGPSDYFSEKAGMRINPESEESIAQGMLEMSQHLNDFKPNDIRDHVVNNFGYEAYGLEAMRRFQEILSI